MFPPANEGNHQPEHSPNSIKLQNPTLRDASQESIESQNAPSQSNIGQFLRARYGWNSFKTSPEAELSLALDKSLKAYHSQLIALGSAIGTGLFIGAGQGLATGGPIPLLLAFAFVGFTLCPTAFALGEMATLLPYPGGFVEHSRIFLDEAWGAAIGWNYAFQWLITLPLELIASSITLQYWGEPLRHRSAWITLFLAGLAIINISGVTGFANVEAALSVMKVVAVVGFMQVLPALPAPTGASHINDNFRLGFGGKAIGTSHWYNPGAVNNGWWGFCSVLVTAAFAFAGSEMVGLTAAEQENPRRDMPKAVRKVFWRIGIFYITSISLIGLLVPYNDPLLISNAGTNNSSASPFVIAVKNAGIPVAPSILNAVILVTVLSVANSSVYGSSRVLNALADAGLAPQAFAYVDTMGRPLRCLYLAFGFGLLAYLAELRQENTVFMWLLALCGLSSIMSWTLICVTHLRFRRALAIHERDLDTLPFRSPLGVVGSWVGLVCNIFIIFVQFLSAIFPVGYQDMTPRSRAQSFFASFMAIPLVIILYVTVKLWKGTTITNLADYDYFTDAYTEERYIEEALDNPAMVLDDLWWCPRPLRKPLSSLSFPW
ncbi:uncharacterized protein BP5553_03233 [Venustampulla echinocandica]|uniref:Amino acid permease/ SLC12A domain-containing protein n=1 Tax=Venustampulla echinocandica TaxID=2656787 RepID=A0A370TTQ3_9HELO|nr:uncharacterized protein BP5553_03233 [Venustampulla echinocandica]RDL38893.1 hypothetical protein BP5553_03233 [Venustampulla echinocandica]